MDAQGFLPISLIASFHRVQALTTDVSLIVEVRAPPAGGGAPPSRRRVTRPLSCPARQ